MEVHFTKITVGKQAIALHDFVSEALVPASSTGGNVTSDEASFK